jgi:hypothetical protein
MWCCTGGENQSGKAAWRVKKIKISAAQTPMSGCDVSSAKSGETEARLQ